MPRLLRYLLCVAAVVVAFCAGVMFARYTEQRDEQPRLVGKLPGGAQVYRFEDRTGAAHVFAVNPSGNVTPLCP